jgi:hypothetical protein
MKFVDENKDEVDESKEPPKIEDADIESEKSEKSGS